MVVSEEMMARTLELLFSPERADDGVVRELAKRETGPYWVIGICRADDETGDFQARRAFITEKMPVSCVDYGIHVEYTPYGPKIVLDNVIGRGGFDMFDVRGVHGVSFTRTHPKLNRNFTYAAQPFKTYDEAVRYTDVARSLLCNRYARADTFDLLGEQ